MVEVTELKTNSLREKIKKNKEIISASFGAGMAYVMSTSPVFAVKGASQIVRSARAFLFPFYVFAVGALCIMSWLKGQTAVAVISLVVGVFLGLVMFAPKFISGILNGLSSAVGGGGIQA